MNQNNKRIIEGELGQVVKNYSKIKLEDTDIAETYKTKIKDILFNLWENGILQLVLTKED